MSTSGEPGEGQGRESEALPRQREPTQSILENGLHADTARTQDFEPGAIEDRPIAQFPPLLQATVRLVGPLALVTALLFYIGYIRTQKLLGYFRVDPSLADFSVQDYLLRSVNAAFWPLAALSVGGLALLWLHRSTSSSLWGSRSFGRGLILAGGIAAALGLISVVWTPLVGDGLVFRPVMFGLAVGCLAYASWLRSRRAGSARTPSPSNAVLVWILILLALFWGVGDYAAVRGSALAKGLEEDLAERPTVEVFSSQRLNIAASEVTETILDQQDPAYRFHYSGLKLLLHAGGKYFLLPSTWSHKDGTTVVLPDTDGLRFEFSP